MSAASPPPPLPSQDDVDNMVQNAEKFAEEDKKRREAVDTKNQAESMVSERTTPAALLPLCPARPPCIAQQVQRSRAYKSAGITVHQQCWLAPPRHHHATLAPRINAAAPGRPH
jgi:hypothetical protein